MCQYVFNKHINLSLHGNGNNTNKVPPKSIFASSLKDKDDSTKRHLSMTKTTMPNTRNSNYTDKTLQSHTIMNYNFIKKNRHISLDINHSKNKIKSNANPKILDIDERSPLHRNILNGKKNSVSKNKRALEYSIKVKQFNMSNHHQSSVSKTRDKSSSNNNLQQIDENTLGSKLSPLKKNCGSCRDIKEEDKLYQNNCNLLNNKKVNKKSRNTNNNNMSFKSSSIDKTQKTCSALGNNNKTTYNYGYTMKIYNEKNKGGETITTTTKGNYTQMYLKKNFFKNIYDNKNNDLIKQIPQSSTREKRKFSPLLGGKI